MRIAVFLGSFPVVSETFILQQITGLLERGHEVDIFADTRAGEGAPVQPEVAKYRLLDRTTFMRAPSASVPWEMPVTPIAGRTWVPGAEKGISNCSRFLQALPSVAAALIRAPRLAVSSLRPSEFGHQARSMSAVYRLATLLRTKKEYDVLHAHFGPVGNSFRFAPKLFGAPFIVSFHGYDAFSVPKQSGSAVYEKLWTSAALLTANSRYMEEAVQGLGCPAAKIRRLGYGIKLDDFPMREHASGDSGPVRVLTVGRLVEKKGIEDSIRAFAQLLQSEPNLVYDIVGDGPLRAHLQTVIESLRVGDRVNLHGAQDADSIRRFLSRCDVFVLASLTASNGDKEGTPVSLLEAQACGIPVISTLHSGIPEIVLNGRTGFLVPEREVGKLAEAMRSLAMNPALRFEMGAAARSFVAEKFAAQGRIRDLESLYASIL